MKIGLAGLGSGGIGRPALRRSAGYLLLACLVAASACVERKMSLEEAKHVSVSVTAPSPSPPPRRVGDILAVLGPEAPDDSVETAVLRSGADEAPPETEDPGTLARFFFQRGLKARDLSRYVQWLEDHRRALAKHEEARTRGSTGLGARGCAHLLVELANVESVFGNLGRSIAHLNRSLRIPAYNPMRKHSMLASLYYKAGHLKAGGEATEAGIRVCDRVLRDAKARPEQKAKAEVQKALLQAASLEVRGRHQEAEPHLRISIRLLDEQLGKQDRKAVLGKRRRLAHNLARQGRLVEAEIEIRDALKRTVGFAGAGAGEVPSMLASFGQILMMQGRLEEAEEVLHAGVRLLQSGGFPADCLVSGRIGRCLGAVAVARGEFGGAMDQYERIREEMGGNAYMLDRLLERNPDYMLSLLKTGHAAEAMKIITGRYREALEHFGEKRYRTVELLALRGMAYAVAREDGKALEDLSASVPRLLAKGSKRSDLLKDKRLQVLSEVYLDLLARVHENGGEGSSRIHVPAEAFRVCQALHGSVVQSALGESGARAAALDPDLADLVRREQDASKQIESLKEILSGAMAAPPDQQDSEALSALSDTVDAMTEARDTILDEIQRRFPRYADFVDPQPSDFSGLQRVLTNTEALIVVFPLGRRTYLWSVPARGEVVFAAASAGIDSIREQVRTLRRTLAPAPGTFGDVPVYDVSLAHELYAALLEPVEAGWKGAEDLLIVAGGPLGQIPFAVLPVEPVEAVRDDGLLFAGYRDVPWLIRKCSLTRLPSVASLVTLRSLPAGDPRRKSFLGFGDPCFDRTRRHREAPVPRSGEGLRVRGIRKTRNTTLESDALTSSRLRMLNRLPDTADEIEGIARVLRADPARDVFLGEKASESRVKGMDLTDRKVVAFATHGLIPGDLDGLEQPALALSEPSPNGDGEDGLLTTEEILRLRMNADWVLLSACNTGAGEGAGSEAVSGLGRAFFYAGTRALLVSMWPVESTSAGRLTTGVFRCRQEDSTLSRSRALRKVMLDLIDRQVVRDESSGRTMASYAHPFFWAPFVVVGDGGQGGRRGG